MLAPTSIYISPQHTPTRVVIGRNCLVKLAVRTRALSTSCWFLSRSGPTHSDGNQGQDHAVQEQDGGRGRPEAAAGQSGRICGTPRAHEETGRSPLLGAIHFARI